VRGSRPGIGRAFRALDSAKGEIALLRRDDGEDVVGEEKYFAAMALTSSRVMAAMRSRRVWP